jgi:NADPH:quinone reductase-like Zn-dependent oxidoreductase
MTEPLHPKYQPEPPPVYQIRVRGHLDGLWSDHFDGLTLTLEADGITLLAGPVVDQAALYGLLKKVRDSGLPLVSVTQAQPGPADKAHSSGGKTMKAIVYTQYGSPEVLQLKEIEKPTPKDDEILIKVRAASVNPLDVYSTRGLPYVVRTQTGLRRPAYTGLGADVAGQVEAVGRSVTRFKPGDEVYGVSRGTFAEYMITKGKAFVLKPARITFEQAAAVPVAALTALQGLRDKGQIQAGQSVLINGAAGGVGTFAVQIAKALEARVTAVCSTRNVDLVRSLGADRVVDYTREDFTHGDARYDLILDNVGNHSLSALRRLLTPDGTYVAIAGSLTRILHLVLLSRLAKKRVHFFVGANKLEDLAFMNELMEAGKVTPVIDRCYPLNEVPAAVRYLSTGHARGKVVVTP